MLARITFHVGADSALSTPWHLNLQNVETREEARAAVERYLAGLPRNGPIDYDIEIWGLNVA